MSSSSRHRRPSSPRRDALQEAVRRGAEGRCGLRPRRRHRDRGAGQEGRTQARSQAPCRARRDRGPRRDARRGSCPGTRRGGSPGCQARSQARPQGTCRRAEGAGRRARAARGPGRSGCQGPVPGTAPRGASRRPAPGQQPVRPEPGHGLAPGAAHARWRRQPSAASAGRRRRRTPRHAAPQPRDDAEVARCLRQRSRRPSGPRWPRWRSRSSGCPRSRWRSGSSRCRCRCPRRRSRSSRWLRPVRWWSPRWRSSRSAWPDPGCLRARWWPVASRAEVQACASYGVRGHGGPDDRWRARPQGQR